MSKAGYKVFDSDAHVSEPPEAIDAYVDSAYKSALDKLKLPGIKTYRPNQIGFQRRLGARRSEGDNAPKAAQPTKGRHRQAPLPNTNTDPHQRIQDMNLEGVDTCVMLPTGVGSFCSVDDLGLERAVIQAYHRYIGDFCKAYPGRLYAAAVVSARNIEWSVEELKRVGKEAWPAAVFPSVPPGMPLDDPELDPLWKAAADNDLTIGLHTFTVLPPYAPGARDGSYFDNYWLARAAAHPWCGMRNMASLIGAGVMDRYPKLRIATLEAGHGWLPFWLARIDEHAKTIKSEIPELKHLPSEYATNGRYFQSIEVPEGEKLTNAVTDLLGDHVLMYASDYPHGESHFPHTVDLVMDWKDTPEARKRKLFWDNAVKCYPRCGLK